MRSLYHIHYTAATLTLYIYKFTHVSLPIETSSKLLAVVGKFSNAIDKLMVGKTLATNVEEIINATIGNDLMAFDWQSLVNWLWKLHV